MNRANQGHIQLGNMYFSLEIFCYFKKEVSKLKAMLFQVMNFEVDYDPKIHKNRFSAKKKFKMNHIPVASITRR